MRAYVSINVRDASTCERACAILENRSFNIAKNKRLTVMLLKLGVPEGLSTNLVKSVPNKKFKNQVF